ncbi:hypothetical protein AAMO2058_000914300 [Amorphochlora amoebiformis]
MEDDGLDCSICAEIMQRAVMTNCGHSFCASCILGKMSCVPFIQCHKSTLADFNYILMSCVGFWQSKIKSESKVSAKPVPCPECSRKVTMLIPNFALRRQAENFERKKDAKNEEESTTTQRDDEQIRDYTERFAIRGDGMSDAISRSRDNIAILRAASRDSLFYKILFYSTLGVVLLYLLLPNDVLPEVSFGPFGFIDDIAVVLLGIWLLDSLASNFTNRPR